MGTVTSPNYTNTHTMADAAPAKKVVKAKKVAKPAAHPPFKAMILTAIKALKEALAAGTIVKAKAAGKGAGKFKAGKVEKPKKVKKVKKPKKPAAKKAKKPAKKAAKKPAKKAAKAAKK